MTRSVRIREFGGPDVLRIEDVSIQEPKAGEVRLRGALIEIDETTGRAVRITRVDEPAAITSGETQSAAVVENEY